MKGFRERMKQHEEYIISIKQMVEGDYDHYEVLKQVTQDKNQKFFDEINETEMILLKFKEICKAKLRKGFLWKSLKTGNLPF